LAALVPADGGFLMSDGYAVKVRPEKVEVVERIKAEVSETQAVVLTEYRGLTVNALKDLRAKLLAAETSYRVEKNTLARRAMGELGLAELEELLVGPVALAYIKGDPVSAAKVLSTFAREHPELVIKGGVLDGRILTEADAKGLATVDALDVSRAKIAGLLTAALRQIAMIAQAPAQRILYVLDQVGKRAPESEAPAEAEAPAAEAPAAEAEPPAPAEAEAAPATEAEASTEAPAEEAPAAEAETQEGE
jgi:large subunit ribosomal protein L10